jgi:hypothetical protein
LQVMHSSARLARIRSNWRDLAKPQHNKHHTTSSMIVRCLCWVKIPFSESSHR